MTKIQEADGDGVQGVQAWTDSVAWANDVAWTDGAGMDGHGMDWTRRER